MRTGVLILLFVALTATAQEPSPTPSPAATPSATPAPSTSPTPSPSPTPLEKPSVDTMSETEIDSTLELLKSTYLDPAALDPLAMKRAAFQGAMNRLGAGVELAPNAEETAAEKRPPLKETLEGDLLYFRLGSLDPENIAVLDEELNKGGPELKAVVLDLRDTPESTSYEAAAEVIKRFVEKGKPLFQLKSPRTSQTRLFTSNSEPLYSGLLMIVTDPQTRKAAEVIAAVLRKKAPRAMIVGAETRGEAVELADFPIEGGKAKLRIAVARVELPNGDTLFPKGVAPDIDITMDPLVQKEIFEKSEKQGVKKFIVDVIPVHFNEAALVSGNNPEIDEYLRRSKNRSKDETFPKDIVLQRAVDVVTAVSVLGHTGR